MSQLNASWAGLAFKVVWNVVLMAHITGMRRSCWADVVSRSWAMRQLERRRFPITWWVHSSIPLAWGFLTVVSLDRIPYDWRSSWNWAETNSVPLSCKQSTGRGYRQSQTWLRESATVMLSLFFQCYNFHEVRIQVNNCKRLKCHRLFWFQRLWWLRNDPGSDGVNCKQMPWISDLLLVWNRYMSILLSLCLVMLASVAMFHEVFNLCA
jgi:hypothetical protein